MCVGERDIVNFADFLFILLGTCNFAVPGTSIAGMGERERRPDSVKQLRLNHDQAHKLVNWWCKSEDTFIYMEDDILIF